MLCGGNWARMKKSIIVIHLPLILIVWFELPSVLPVWRRGKNSRFSVYLYYSLLELRTPTKSMKSNKMFCYVFLLCTHLIHKHSFRHHVDLSCLLSKSFSFDIVKLSHPQFYTSHWSVLRRCIAKPSSERCRVSVKRVNMKNCQNVRMVKNFISSTMCFVIVQSKNFCTFVRELAV